MPQIIDVPGQGQVEFPDGMDDAAIVAAIRNISSPQKPNFGQNLKQGLGNLAAGAIRGAGSIGSTLVAPYDIAKDALAGKGLSLESNRERRHAIDMGLSGLGADVDSGLYKTGKIAGEIAGTAGVPGALAKSAQFAGAAPALVNALRTGGFSASGLPARLAAGAATGAATAGLANPEEAGTGALIGGALPGVVSLLRGGAKLAKETLGGSTGVGSDALTQAYQAGQKGGATGKAFADAMRGQSSMDDVLTAAKQNLDAMVAQKQASYRQGMTNIKADKSILDLQNIEKSVDDALKMATFKGQVKNERAADALGQIKSSIDEWRSLDPAEFHTPEGLDALKQKIGAMVEEIPFEQKTARAAAGRVYDSIRSEITKQAPEYSKVMKDYSTASDTIKEIERALSLGQKASADTAMRKLQSLMRNNVNTSYGYRQNLAKELEQAGGQELMPSLAGQALQEWTPRGIQRATAGTGSVGLAALGNIPAAAMVAGASSPRLVGEGMYKAGQISGMVPAKLAELLRAGFVSGAPIAGSQ